MPTNEQHPAEQATQQATNDELAELYLRGRDTPCPSCNYNRRDSTSATCPECGTKLVLMGTDSTLVPKYDKLAQAVLLVIALTALFTVLQKSYTLFRLIRMIAEDSLGYLITDYSSAILALVGACVYFLWIALFVIALRRWLIVRQGTPIQIEKIIRPAAAMLVLYAIQTISYYLAIFFIY